MMIGGHISSVVHKELLERMYQQNQGHRCGADSQPP